MSVRREPSGRWRAVVKQRGQYVTGRTFDTKREAEAWERRQLAVLAGGTDPRAGRALVGDLLPEWVAHRQATVAHKTAQADRLLAEWIPLSMRRLSVGHVTTGHVSDLLADLARQGKARSSLARFRAVLAGFFGWCVDHGYTATSPVVGVRIPSSARPVAEMRPYTRIELDARLAVWRILDEDAASVVEFMAATGLRWSEMRALTPADVQEVPYPAVIVSRAEPENAPLKGTKSGKTRRVPVPAHVAPWLLSRLGAEYIAPIRWIKTLRARLDWSTTSAGRTTHDLRHTAITLWLAAGVDVATVRAWAGHADLTTTSRYVHWLGSDADRAALDRINEAQARAGHTSSEGRSVRTT